MNAGNLDLSGVEQFTSTPEEVFGVVTDIDRMPALIPDLQSHQKIDDDRLKCIVRPGFSFIRGKLNLEIQMTEIKPPESALMRVTAKGIGMEIDIESRFKVSPAEGGTQMAWSARVTRLKGLVAAVSPALTTAAAEVVLRASWGQLREQLGESE